MPLEGLLPAARIEQLAEEVEALGGRVSRRDGGAPYELNATYYSALGDGPGRTERFLASQAVMLALAGIPAVYVHSLFGTPNDLSGVRVTGRARSINRRRYAEDEIEALLADPSTPTARVWHGLRRQLAARVAEPAFHPEGPQQTVDAGHPAVLAFRRISPDGGRRVLVVANLGPLPLAVPLPDAGGDGPGLRPRGVHPRDVRARDLLDADDTGLVDGRVVLSPWQCRWLVED
jgi:sucrose phosphorylase